MMNLYHRNWNLAGILISLLAITGIGTLLRDAITRHDNTKIIIGCIGILLFTLWGIRFWLRYRAGR